MKTSVSGVGVGVGLSNSEHFYLGSSKLIGPHWDARKEKLLNRLKLATIIMAVMQFLMILGMIGWLQK